MEIIIKKYFLMGYLWETFLGPVFKPLRKLFLNCVSLNHSYLVDQVIPKKETSAVVMTVGSFVFICELWCCRETITAQYFYYKAVGFTLR